MKGRLGGGTIGLHVSSLCCRNGLMSLVKGRGGVCVRGERNLDVVSGGKGYQSSDYVKCDQYIKSNSDSNNKQKQNLQHQRVLLHSNTSIIGQRVFFSSSSSSYGNDDPYKILGVARNDSSDKIQKAYRALALKYHPDRHTQSSETLRKSAAEMFKRVSAAYYVLGDDSRRKEFDDRRQFRSYSYNNVNRSGNYYGTGKNPYDNYYNYYQSTRTSGRRAHEEAEEMFRRVFGSGNLDDIINEMLKANSRMGNQYSESGRTFQTQRQYTKRRHDGTNVLVNERVLRHADGRVETITTETEIDSYYNKHTTTRRSTEPSSSSNSLQTSFLSQIVGRAIAGFVISIVPKVISWLLRFILIGGRRR